MAQIWNHSQGANFCPRCGTLLLFSDAGSVNCDKCEYTCAISDLPTLSVVTSSHSKPLPAWIKAHLGVKSTQDLGRATTNEECPACGNPTMEFYTKQLRSADEGQTVFYECKKCGHKFSVNT